MTTCNTCGKTADKPFRVYDSNGRVIHGCVDGFHNEHLIPFSESSLWHNRKEAKSIRAGLKRYSAGQGA